MARWDADGNPITLKSTGLTYDAFDREVETASGSTYTQILYSPVGKLGLMNGQVPKTIRVALPGGSTAQISGPTGGNLTTLHSDWLGSSRLATTFNGRAMAYDVAYAPYGENYAPSGGVTSDSNFTGQSQDTLSGLYDFLYREYNPVQGRWISPDPSGLSAVDPSNPQSWNRYAYVLNNPLSAVDPDGLDCVYVYDVVYKSGDYAQTEYFADVKPGDCISSWDNGYYVDGTVDPKTYVLDQNGNLQIGYKAEDGSVGVYVAEGAFDPSSFDNSNANNFSWLGAFASNLFSWQNARQAQTDAWNRGYYKCLGKKTAGGATAPVVTHAVGVAATNAAESGASTLAGAYYHFTDGRFTAWGKYSKVLVPNLAPKIATAAKVLDVAGWAYFDYELANAISECSDVLQ